MKRILFLTFYYKPDLSAGSFRITALVNELKKRIEQDYEVSILTTMPNRYNTYLQEAESTEIDGNIKIIRFHLPNHKSGFKDQIKAFFAYYKQVLTYVKNENYDIVFATSSRLFTAFLGAKIAKMKKSVLLLDIRDIFNDTLKSLLNPFVYLFLKIPLNLVENYTFKKASKINLVSEGFKPYFQNKFPDINYTFYYNGIDDEFLNYDFKKQATNNIKIITYAGNIGQGQGLEMIIPDLALFLGPKYEIRIIGDGGKKKNLLERINQKNIKNVKIIKPLKREELLEFYKETDYLFLHLNNVPAFKKVLPSKVFEYAAINKPIIAGVDGFARKFLNEYLPSIIIFDPGSLESFKINFKPKDTTEVNYADFIKKFTRKNIMQKMVNDFF